MQNDTQRIPVSGMYSANPMALGNAVETAGSGDRPVDYRKDHGVAPIKPDHFGPGLHAGALFGQYEFSTGEIIAW